jgi:uncharacterized membrane protein YbaN (DUF454 family)
MLLTLMTHSFVKSDYRLRAIFLEHRLPATLHGRPGQAVSIDRKLAVIVVLGFKMFLLVCANERGSVQVRISKLLLTALRQVVMNTSTLCDQMANKDRGRNDFVGLFLQS